MKTYSKISEAQTIQELAKAIVIVIELSPKKAGKGGHWNGVVYGKGADAHIFIDGNKISLTEDFSEIKLANEMEKVNSSMPFEVMDIVDEEYKEGEINEEEAYEKILPLLG